MSMTPEEQKTLAAIEAAKAAGQDPFGDDEPMGQEDDAPAEAAVAVAEAQPDAGETPATGAQEEVAATDATSPNPGEQADKVAPTVAQDTEQPMQYQAEVPADYPAKRAELVKAKADAMRKLLNGEVDADEFAAEDARISGELEELSAARIRAETLQDANRQASVLYQQQALKRLVTKVKGDVDYAADESARKQFDTALKVLAADGDGRDFADLIDEAHAIVSARRGIATSKAPQATPATRKPDGTPPVTLRGIPSASTPNTGSVVDQLARLKGPAYEAAYARLTPAQKASLLDGD
jgi:hypothetical protein